MITFHYYDTLLSLLPFLYFCLLEKGTWYSLLAYSHFSINNHFVWRKWKQIRSAHLESWMILCQSNKKVARVQRGCHDQFYKSLRRETLIQSSLISWTKKQCQKVNGRKVICILLKQFAFGKQRRQFLRQLQETLLNLSCLRGQKGFFKIGRALFVSSNFIFLFPRELTFSDNRSLISLTRAEIESSEIESNVWAHKWDHQSCKRPWTSQQGYKSR